MIRSELDVLLDKVKDEALRADLRTQIDRLKQRRSFGLVFERHIPERVRLPQHPVRVGSQVVSRDNDDIPTSGRGVDLPFQVPEAPRWDPTISLEATDDDAWGDPVLRGCLAYGALIESSAAQQLARRKVGEERVARKRIRRDFVVARRTVVAKFFHDTPPASALGPLPPPSRGRARLSGT
jgi:hypothetical protein